MDRMQGVCSLHSTFINMTHDSHLTDTWQSPDWHMTVTRLTHDSHLTDGIYYQMYLFGHMLAE